MEADNAENINLIKEGSYAYFKRFYMDPKEALKFKKWKRHLEKFEEGTDKIIDIGRIIRENFSFGDSADNPGLQLVDILANTFTRAMKGRLAFNGWRQLGSLMVGHGAKIRIMHVLSPSLKNRLMNAHQLSVLSEIARNSKPMIYTE